MCKPASMVITRDSVYWSKNTDGHEEIITEFGLSETGLAGKIGLVRIEVSPPDGNLSRPVSEWKFKTDQGGLLPDWYDAAGAERRARVVIASWWAQKVILAKRAVFSGNYYAYDSANVVKWTDTVAVTLSDFAVCIDRSKIGVPVVTVGSHAPGPV